MQREDRRDPRDVNQRIQLGRCRVVVLAHLCELTEFPFLRQLNGEFLDLLLEVILGRICDRRGRIGWEVGKQIVVTVRKLRIQAEFMG